MVSSVIPVSPSTRHPARRHSFSAASRSPLSRPAKDREALPTGVLNVVKSVCVNLRVGPVRRCRRGSTNARPDAKQAVTPTSTSTPERERSLVRTASMEGLLECLNCGESFDLERRRPKLLPCGHTHCQSCVLASLRNNRVICPTDKLIVHVDAQHLQDDLQLICWLEATAQGLLECVCCGVSFDWLLRRPTALDCGHSVCRVCLQEAGQGPLGLGLGAQPCSPLPLPRPLPRSDSIDESWDYAQEDGGAQGVLQDGLQDRDGADTCSLVSSLSSDEGVALSLGAGELLVDCPIDGCLKGVRARDHLHLLGCLNDTAAPRNRVKRAIRCEDQLLEKLAQLEKKIASVYGESPKALAKLTKLDRSAAGHDFKDPDMSALLASVRQLVEHKSFVGFQDSPRSEPSAFKQALTVANCTLPDPDLLNKAALKVKEDVNGISSLKECQVELDVYDLALYGPGEMRVKKEAVFRSDKKVWKLTGVDCWCDPEWTLRLLRRCGPQLEQLQLQYPGREHLQAVRDCMPRLRRLEVRGWSGLDALKEPFLFDQGGLACKRDTLEWLEVFLPTATALSLVRAHRGTLRKLRLVVADEWGAPSTGTCRGGADDFVVVPDTDVVVPDTDVVEVPGVEECDWPEEDGFAVVPMGEECLGLGRGASSRWDDLLQECGGAVVDQVAMQSVSLLWLSARAHDTWACSKFARALHDARPHIQVACDVCRRVGLDLR